MRIYISADIEGCTGLVSWSQCGRPKGEYYDYGFARRMMTHDVNAAIRGARRAGAAEIVVKDSHGNSKNLLIDQLEPGVELVSGHGSGIDGMMEGIQSGFDAMLLVGYHAMAGTKGGVMEHTITGGIHRLHVGDLEMGEIGLSTLTAEFFGVNLAMICSDAAGCSEAVSLRPNIKTAVTKTGFGRYMAQAKSPDITGPQIEAAAFEAAIAAKEWPKPKQIEPTFAKIEFNRAEEADMVEQLLRVDRLDGYTVRTDTMPWPDLHRLVWNAVSMSFEGIDAKN